MNRLGVGRRLGVHGSSIGLGQAEDVWTRVDRRVGGTESNVVHWSRVEDPMSSLLRSVHAAVLRRTFQPIKLLYWSEEPIMATQRGGNQYPSGVKMIKRSTIKD